MGEGREVWVEGGWVEGKGVGGGRCGTLAATHIPLIKPPADTDATMASSSGTYNQMLHMINN